MSPVLRAFFASLLVWVSLAPYAHAANQSEGFIRLDQAVQSRVVKLYGAGGVRGLEGQQTGLLVSAEGLILTVDTVLLESGLLESGFSGSGEATAVTSLGDRYTARVVAADRLTGIALLKIDTGDAVPPHFELSDNNRAAPATPVWIFSNAFGIAAGQEPVSVQRGVVSGYAPLEAAGPFESAPGIDDVVILDAVVSNPGAGGGAVVDERGRLVGMIGRETRSRSTGGWLNHALPTEILVKALERMVEGGAGAESEPGANGRSRTEVFTSRMRLNDTGLVLVPSITKQTPAYIETVTTGSPAEAAGFRADDLIVAIDGKAVAQVHKAIERLCGVDSQSRTGVKALSVTVLRGGEVVEISLAGEEAFP